MTPVAVAILTLSIAFTDHPSVRSTQPMESLKACLELAEAWLTQSGEAPSLRHGAKLTAGCTVTIEPSIDH